MIGPLLMFSLSFVLFFVFAIEARDLHLRHKIMGERFRSDQQLHKLAAGIAAYREANNDEWPDRLTDIQDCIDGNFETLIENPYTKDNPGYEYVKPAENADRSTSIILYQLRDGKRDLSLNVGFGDCRVSANTTAAKQ